MSENNGIPLPQRMGNLESAIHSITDTLDSIKGFMAGIPVVGNVVANAATVGHVIEGVIDLSQGEVSVDSASLAAGNIAISTGDSALDARLMAIEAFIAAAAPLIKFVANEFGMTFTDPVPAPAVMPALTV